MKGIVSWTGIGKNEWFGCTTSSNRTQCYEPEVNVHRLVFSDEIISMLDKYVWIYFLKQDTSFLTKIYIDNGMISFVKSLRPMINIKRSDYYNGEL